MKTHILIYGLAVLIRLWLAFTDIQDDIAARIEVSTPINSFYRILESYHRINIGVDPYSSNILHESPVFLYFFKFLIDIMGTYLPVAFIACDIITAFILYLFARRYILDIQVEEYLNKHSYSKDARCEMLKASDYEPIPTYVTVMYLFNPYVIFNCVGCTTTTFLNLSLALFFYGISCRSIFISTLSIILGSIQAFYPIVLISPLFLLALQCQKSKAKAAIPVVVCVLLLCLSVLGMCFMMGDTYFLQHTIGFILGITDQQPNIGIYWYIFTEMFEHYKTLFIYSFQINVMILYLLPLSIKFRKDLVLLSMCLVMLTTIFKSYPCIGDFGFILAILPCWKYMYNSMQQIFISGVAIVVSTTLAPILWDLWIYWGTANANFYFGITMAFITAHIFLLTDISFAYTKHEHLVKYGNNRKIDGKIAKLMLE